MMRPIRVLIAMSLLLVSACATQVPPPPPAVAASVPIPQRMPMPMPVGTYVGMPVPALMPGGDYATPNVGLSSAAAIWHLRSGLNFAALACRGPEEVVIVARYNALLAAQKPVFAGAEVAVPAFQCACAGDARRLGVDVDAAVGDHLGESGKAIQPVRVDAVTRGLREEACTQAGAIALQAEMLHRSLERLVKVVIGNSEHGGDSSAEDYGRVAGEAFACWNALGEGASFHISVGAEDA